MCIIFVYENKLGERAGIFESENLEIERPQRRSRKKKMPSM